MSDAALLLVLTLAMLSAGVLRAVRCSFPSSPSVLPTGSSEPPRSEVVTRRGIGAAVLRASIPVLALFCTAGLVCGGIRRYFGKIHETLTIGEYRFKITSERESEYADCSWPGDDIFMSISHQGQLLAERIHFGFVSEYDPAPTFTVLQLPNESLIIFTLIDRETEVVFAFDTATGESCPWKSCQPYEAYVQRCERWGARIHASLGDSRHRIRSYYRQM